MNEFYWSPETAQAFTDYHVIVRGRAASSAKKYCRYAKAFFGWVNENGLSLDKSTVEAWMKQLASPPQYMSNESRQTRLAGVRSICKWLLERGDITLNPCLGVPSPKVTKKSAQKFSPAELRLLFSEADSKNVTNLRDRTILMLFYATGVRREEMCNLTLDRLTMGQRTARIQVIGKGRKHRVIAFEGPVVALLKTWLAARALYTSPSDESVFVSLHGATHGTKMTTQAMHDTIKRVAKRVGLRAQGVFLHKLRSTYATDLYDAGIPLAEIAMLMGHSSITTTEGYIAISERHLQKARIPMSKWQELGTTE